MYPDIDTIVDPDLLAQMIEQGYVRDRYHPAHPLVILNYTEKAQYDRVWNDATRRCRGLIVNRHGKVIARPWAKFYNHGQPEAGDLDLTAAVEVTDKADGSLGILYSAGAHPAIATRGSFTSEQALHATDLYRARYDGRWEPVPGWTYLFEIVYPGNRIVLDYAGLDDLILLGAVHNDTGMAVGPTSRQCSGWPGPRTEVFRYGTLAEALAAEPRKNAEGYVVRYLATGDMVKIKQDDYVALHKLVTGLNERAVWERLGAGETTEGICAQLPDEFHPWVTDVAARLLAAQRDTLEATHAAHRRILDALPKGWGRKEYAMAAMREGALRPWLFNVLDGKDPSDAIWKTLRPSVDNTLVAVSEDVA